MASLVDSNILVYVFDFRSQHKRCIAEELLLRGLSQNTLRIPHQAILEFVSAVTRPGREGRSLLSTAEARREAEDFLNAFEILYPNDGVLRTALRGAAAYQLNWFDAHLWAYAEYYSLEELISEDFEHDRMYGTVRAVNPFV